ncbi:MAG: translation elongation factor Ts [Spirochaetales bacterium]|nr:translation elongation factor Ts [Spirochaetales bacterium]
MEIKASMVKELREITGAGMMECKKALVQADGDFAKAEKILKELGLAAAKKRDGRATNEGRIFSRLDGNRGILLELSCETDFVAKNKDFIALGEKCLDIIIEKNLTEITEDLNLCVKDTIARIKENIILKRFKVIEAKDDEFLVDYIHESKIGVIIKFSSGGNPALKNNEKVKTTTFDLALHAAAFAPLYLDRDKINPEYLKEQEEIFKKQAGKLDKPEKVIQGIVKGKLNNHIAEICFVEQGFVRDDKLKVSTVLKNLGKEAGGTISITDFLYFKLGT